MRMVPVYTFGRMNQIILSPDLTVSTVLDHWGEAASVFIAFRMACVGCPLSCFESLAAAAKNYGLAPDLLVERINEVILRSPVEGPGQ